MLEAEVRTFDGAEPILLLAGRDLYVVCLCFAVVAAGWCKVIGPGGDNCALMGAASADTSPVSGYGDGRQKSEYQGQSQRGDLG